jgi:hypothetical protein
MKSSGQTDVIEFQTWLNQSIRRVWILAIAVAIPGAFLLTVWFPHSPEALVGVAILGIAIGVVSDNIEWAKKRRFEESHRITLELQKAFKSQIRPTFQEVFDDLILYIDEQLSSKFSGMEDRVIYRLDDTRDAANAALDSSRSMVEQIIISHNLLTRIMERLATNVVASGSSQESASSSTLKTSLLAPAQILKMMEGQSMEPSDTPERQHHGSAMLEKSTLLANKELQREILLELDLIALERNIPIAEFLSYLRVVASNSEEFLRLRQESKTTR